MTDTAATSEGITATGLKGTVDILPCKAPLCEAVWRDTVAFITSALGGGKQSSLHNCPPHQSKNNANYTIHRQLSGPHTWPKCNAKDKSLSILGSEPWSPNQQPSPYTD